MFRERPRLLGRIEHGTKLHREAHVALDLDLPLHEGLLRVETARAHLDKVVGTDSHRHVRLGLCLALVNGPRAILEVDDPVIAALDDKLDDALDL